MSPSPTDRIRIEAVFDALVDLSTDKQMAYLDRTASDDPELREEVSRLLRAHRRSEGFVEAPPRPLLARAYSALGNADEAALEERMANAALGGQPAGVRGGSGVLPVSAPARAGPWCAPP